MNVTEGGSCSKECIVFVFRQQIDHFNFKSIYPITEKPLLNLYLILYTMKAVVYSSIIILLLVFLLTSPFTLAQNDEEEEEQQDDGSACIFGTFCIIMLFLLYMVYLGNKRKSERSQEQRVKGQYPTPPPPRSGYRYPPRYPAYPPPPAARHPRPPPQKKDVKCDLCGSKNLRTFEEGYFKCNECRHVFYISESYRQKRR